MNFPKNLFPNLFPGLHIRRTRERGQQQPECLRRLVPALEKLRQGIAAFIRQSVAPTFRIAENGLLDLFGSTEEFKRREDRSAIDISHEFSDQLFLASERAVGAHFFCDFYLLDELFVGIYLV